MPIVEEKYEQSKIDRLRNYLQREAEKNRARDYEILVDDFKIVSRTNDAKEFDDFEAEVKPDTRNVSVLIFDGLNTNRNTRYSFTLGEQVAKPLNGLGEVEQIVSQKLAEKERDYELGRLKEKLEETQGQLEEAEEYSEQLQARITTLEEEKKTRIASIGDLGAGLLMGLLKKNAHQLGGLAGLLGMEDAPVLPAGQLPDNGTASYSKADNGNLDPATLQRLQLIEQMQQKLDEPQLIGLLNIISHLTENPTQISTVIDLLSK